jgi:spore germination cell wall hydrolase CwlJ-like protein
MRTAARTGALVLSLTAAALLAFGVSAHERAESIRDAAVSRLAPLLAMDLSERGLQRMASRMDRSAAALALRHDPLRGTGDPALLGRTPGWERLNLASVPTLGVQPVTVEDAQRINRLIPVAAAIGPARPFLLQAASGAERDRAIRCLTAAIYYEAALEPELGQRAVAQVVLNRVKHPEYPKSVCGVVFQGWERTTGCQFSFTCDGSLLRAPMADIWSRARRYATEALAGYVVPEVGTSTFYHADYVLPYWAPTLTKVNQIGRHIFYRWPGNVGLQPAFNGRYRGGELALSEAVLTGRAARPKPLITADGLESLLGPDGKPLIETITVADASAPGGERTRVHAVIAGRRVASKEDIARINETLSKTVAETAAPAPASSAPAAGSNMDLADDLPMPVAASGMAVTEVNKTK